MNRIIGQFGGVHPGPLVVMIAALHGNEPAGVRALQEVFKLLQRMADQQPGFIFQGKLVGLIGHCQAFIAGQRYIQQDLNRLWLADTVQRTLVENSENLRGEHLEIRELYSAICNVVQSERPGTLVLLDLHTTSATGGVFCIPTDEAGSLDLARALHTPVILDLLKGLTGTLLGFAAAGNFIQHGWPQRTLGVAFEAGQHDDPLSVTRSISAILHCLRAVGCIQPGSVENGYDVILEQYSAGLPPVTRLLYVHPVQPVDHFKMRPGYVNFQPVRTGEHLADDDQGPVFAPCAGLILMPLYQPQGVDGFFLVTAE